MANPIPHTLTEANGHIKSSAGLGKPLPIQNFEEKSLQLVITGAGDYDVQVSNDKATWVTIAANVTAGNTLVRTGVLATELPRKVAWLVIDTNVFEAGDEAFFLGEDAG